MFGDIKVPFNSVMLYNVAKLKEGVTITDVEEHLGAMCNIVKNKYKGFLAGQVFQVKNAMEILNSQSAHLSHAKRAQKRKPGCRSQFNFYTFIT